uniref:Uncharacterized protein n=1 Tax=Piliocolobus tephrosceles TaxID=591936 RepID=A0A8C9J731_9PRIM
MKVASPPLQRRFLSAIIERNSSLNKLYSFHSLKTTWIMYNSQPRFKKITRGKTTFSWIKIIFRRK